MSSHELRAAVSGACYRLEGDHLVAVADPRAPVNARAELIHEQIRALISSRRFSCLGAKAAMQAGQYWIGVYDELGTDAAGRLLAADLGAFSQQLDERDTGDRALRTFVASFAEPVCATEHAFETLVWRQLQQLHEHDQVAYPWDPSVSSDPADPHFSFSVGGGAYFVVGLHAASSRWARRFAWPTLVFNPHHQFQRLRDQGVFTRFRDQIRERDRALRQSNNPMLGDFGAHSEARQYTGRKVEHDWQCPFRAGTAASEPEAAADSPASEDGTWLSSEAGGDSPSHRSTG